MRRPPPPEDDPRARALRLLARREHSRAELRRKLAAHGHGGEEIEALLDQLQAQGLLSEARLVEAVVHARSGRYGRARIVHELREKGVSEALIAEGVPRDEAAELEAARAVWRRRFGQPPADRAEWARQARFLQARGFSSELIRRLLRFDPD